MIPAPTKEQIAEDAKRFTKAERAWAIEQAIKNAGGSNGGIDPDHIIRDAEKLLAYMHDGIVPQNNVIAEYKIPEPHFFTTDGDGHWYMIPSREKEHWRRAIADCEKPNRPIAVEEESYEYLNNNFGQYRTGGSIHGIEFFPILADKQ